MVPSNTGKTRMEEDQESKHFCKFCNKSFPSGRSLGGHIRSHLNNQKVNKKKLRILTNNGSNGGDEACDQISYKLRENPKRTNKFSKSSEDTLLHSQLCKKCGKSFQSWKALCGHMKGHSERSSNSLEDSQSDNEVSAPNRKKRSRRIVKRYMVSNTTIANNSSHCVSNNQEQEEIAMSLILLSMDVGNFSGLNSIGESSGNNSVFLEAPLLSQTNQKTEKEKFESPVLDSKKESTLKISEVDIDEKSKKIDQVVEFSKNLIKEKEKNQTKKKFSRKRKSSDHSNLEFTNRFQCTSCNKTFDSFQALGGHRASHRRINGSSTSKIDSSETSIEIELDSTLIKCNSFNKFIENCDGSKKRTEHECTICFRVFSSGQALGGHKRSHVIAEAKGKKSTHVIEKSIPEVRDFLDLNLPPPVEEESSDRDGFNFKPWWIGSNYSDNQQFKLDL